MTSRIPKTQDMTSITVKAGNVAIGGGNPIVVQTMCNTHTSDVEATLGQCRRLYGAGAEMIRLTVPGPGDIAPLKEIHRRLREEGIDTPLAQEIKRPAHTVLQSDEIALFIRSVTARITLQDSFHDRAFTPLEKRQVIKIEIACHSLLFNRQPPN